MAWLSVKETAELLEVTERAVQLSKDKYNHRYVNGKGRGGKVLKIALESLDQPYQDRYYGIQQESKDVLCFTGKQREQADFKAFIVNQYWQSQLTPNLFIENFNRENPMDVITKSQLFRWQRKYKNGDVIALIDARGGHNKGQTFIDENAWEYFYCLYMTQQKRSVKLCYDLTKKKFSNIPSVSAFERKVLTIPKYALIEFQEGENALRDLLPSMKRSRLDINSNDIWFSDHHILDVFVTNKSGKAKRLWLTTFFDARSNKVVSFIARDADPNATVVKQCFRQGIEEFGMPNEVYFDNGKDYRAKDFSKDYPISLVNQLSFNIIYATSYHGQAKTVERFFGTLESRFGKLFSTYAGSNAKLRPECMQIPNEKIALIAPSMDEFIQALSEYISEYNNTQSSGIDMNNKCPNQVYFENLKIKRNIRDTDALRLLCGVSSERTVHKNGVSIKNNNYWGELLIAHLGEKVIVTYDPANIDKVSIFDMENKAICVAYAKRLTPFRHTSEEDYIRASKEKKAVRAFNKKYKPTRELSIHEIIARNQLEEKHYAEGYDTTVIEHISPKTAIIQKY